MCLGKTPLNIQSIYLPDDRHIRLFYNLTVMRTLVINMNPHTYLWKVGYYALEYMHWSHMKREYMPNHIFHYWGASMLIYTVFGLICVPICSDSVNTDFSCQASSAFISFLCFSFIHLFYFHHILVFWEIHRFCFAYIHPYTTSSKSTTLLTHPTLCSMFCFWPINSKW